MAGAGAIAAIVEWLGDGARSAPTSESVLAELCRRLVEAGMPLARGAVFVRTLHPQVMGRRFTWRPDSGVTVFEAPHRIRDTADYRDSPIPYLSQTLAPLRRRLTADSLDFPVLYEFKDQGMTDYLAVPLVFTNGEVHGASWATDRPGGFADAEIAALLAVCRALAHVAEIRALRRTATTLLETYVGRRSGARILSGHIRRGDVEALDAALWYSDLRDFTGLNERLAPTDLLDLLNAYFLAVGTAVADHGGEVLQFIGDAALAVFPVGDAGRPEACRQALAAARAALGAAAADNRQRDDAGQPPIRFGIGLHVGAVSWGNVGSLDRLGLNVVGPAVNRTARIEGLTKELGTPLLLSEDFALAAGEPCRPVGRHTLRGVPEPQAVYADGA